VGGALDVIVLAAMACIGRFGCDRDGGHDGGETEQP
jgi:hypothetical protein